ncbi:MucD [Nitrospira sp.]|nr:MucD [Nitrospira sp.]
MRSAWQSRGGQLLAVLGVGALIAWGSGTFPDSHAAVEQASPSKSTVTVPQANGNGFARVAKAVTPAVVNITASARAERSGGREDSRDELRDRLEEFFGSPFGPNGPRGRRGPGMPREGMGSGVIVTSDGYILTNNHVVAGAEELIVSLPDKREFKAKLVGADPKSDLAVIKVDAEGLPTVNWGDSASLEVGEYVLAVGNPFGLNSTVTLGIVSALGRGKMGITQYEEFIQTDAAINPGNSGGALVNTSGQLVGVNTAIFSQSGGNDGVGFAVPTSMAKPIFESIVKTGKVVRGYLGIGIQDLDKDIAKSFGLEDVKGALVNDVQDESPASKGGLQSGDIIVKYQDRPIEDAVALQRQVTRTRIGTKAALKVIRNGREQELHVTIGELPDVVQTARADRESGEHALAGMAVQELDGDSARELGLKPGTKGVVIADIDPEGSAAQAGLSRGDVIREINREPVSSINDFERIAAGLKKDDRALLLINRRGSSIFVSVKV